MMKWIFLAAALVLGSTVTAPLGDARAASSEWLRTDHTAVRLVAAAQAVGTGETVSLGLHFRLNEGWKIYWRSPGDAGYPPKPDWSGSENLKAMGMQWPAPVRFSVLGLETLGYKDEVLYPLTATLDAPGAPLKVKAKVDYLACDEVCIPYTAELALDLPAGDATPSADAHVINRFAALPQLLRSSRGPRLGGGIEIELIGGTGEDHRPGVPALGNYPPLTTDLALQSRQFCSHRLQGRYR